MQNPVAFFFVENGIVDYAYREDRFKIMQRDYPRQYEALMATCGRGGRWVAAYFKPDNALTRSEVQQKCLRPTEKGFSYSDNAIDWQNASREVMLEKWVSREGDAWVDGGVPDPLPYSLVVLVDEVIAQIQSHSPVMDQDFFLEFERLEREYSEKLKKEAQPVNPNPLESDGATSTKASESGSAGVPVSP